MASQCSHAAVSCYKQARISKPSVVDDWELQGQPKIVLRANQAGEQNLTELAGRAARVGLDAVIIRDAGRTEVASGTATVLGIGPVEASIIDQLTKTYRLL